MLSGFVAFPHQADGVAVGDISAQMRRRDGVDKACAHSEVVGSRGVQEKSIMARPPSGSVSVYCSQMYSMTRCFGHASGSSNSDTRRRWRCRKVPSSSVMDVETDRISSPTVVKVTRRCGTRRFFAFTIGSQAV